jgi:uncharacterized membrane protein YhaH (DUF805 family)
LRALAAQQRICEAAFTGTLGTTRGIMWTTLLRGISRAVWSVHHAFFTLEGRLNRGAFLARYCVVYLLIFIPAVAGVVEVLDSATRDASAALISGAAAVTLLTASVPLLVRRFHDFGLSGHEVAVYYFLGGLIGAVRTVAMQAESTHVSTTLAQGEMSTWLLVWHVPGLVWAMAPFLIPGDRAANRYGPSTAGAFVTKRQLQRRRMGGTGDEPLPATSRMAF